MGSAQEQLRETLWPALLCHLATVEKNSGGTLFAADDGVDPMEIAAHGGSFPIRVAGAGIIGSITVSGVPGRDDHGFVVAAIAQHLGLDAAALAFAPEYPACHARALRGR